MEILQNFDPLMVGIICWVLALITVSLPFIPASIKKLAYPILSLGITKAYAKMKEKSESKKDV